MNFEEYLVSKKIDPQKFKTGEPERWQEWQDVFEEVHPKSFTDQKLFLINKMRRLYFLEPQKEISEVTKDVKKARPMIKPKPQKP